MAAKPADEGIYPRSRCRFAFLPRTVYTVRIHKIRHLSILPIVISFTSGVPIFPRAILHDQPHRLLARVLRVIDLTAGFAVVQSKAYALAEAIFVEQRLGCRVSVHDHIWIHERSVVMSLPVEHFASYLVTSSRDDVVDDGLVRPGTGLGTGRAGVGAGSWNVADLVGFIPDSDTDTCSS